VLKLKCGDEIVFVARIKALAKDIIVNDDRKGWPTTQMTPDRSPVCATKSETETVW